MKVSAEALAWVDELDHVQLLDELARAGLAVDGDPANADPAPPEQDGPTYQLIPLGQAWLRIEADTGGRLLGSLIPDARYPEVSDGQPPIRFDDNSEDLDGWFSTRADIDASGRRWVSVLRRPERESYVALVYDAAADRPQRQVLMQGTTPTSAWSTTAIRWCSSSPTRSSGVGSGRCWPGPTTPPSTPPAR